MADTKKKQPKITLYEHVNFKGRSITFTEANDNLIDAGFNDYTSSVIVEGGVWVLYSDCYHLGNICVVVEGDRTNLLNCTKDSDSKIHDFNDVVSSLKPLDFDLEEDPKCTVYAAAGFSGRSLEFTEDILDLGWYNMKNQISSIKVHSGAWIGYDMADFRGQHSLYLPGDLSMSSSEGGFRNDKLCSLRAIQIKPSSYPLILDKMDYHIKRGNCEKTPVSTFSWRQTNNTTVTQNLSISKEKSVTTENTYQFNWEQGTKVTAEFTTKVGLFTEGSFKLGLEAHYNIGSTERQKTAKTDNWVINYPTVIPPKTTITMESTLTEGKINVPFTAHFHQGEEKWTEEGFFHGTIYYGFDTKFNQE